MAYRLPISATAKLPVIFVAARSVMLAIVTTTAADCCRPRQLAICAVIARLVEEPTLTMSPAVIAADLLPPFALSAIRFATVRLAGSDFAGVELEIKVIASTKFLLRHQLVLTSTAVKLEESEGH